MLRFFLMVKLPLVCLCFKSPTLHGKIEDFPSPIHFPSTRPGNLLHSELERSTISNGKTHYFNGHFQ